jgi:hypothetical protein
MFRCPHCREKIPNRLITAHSGSIGGRKTAKRGPEYFRKIASLRKHHRGGRPPKKTTSKDLIP